MGSPVKSKKSGKESIALLKKSKHLGSVFQDYPPKVFSAESWKMRIESHRQILQGHGGTTLKFGKRKGASRGVMQQCEPQERNPCAPQFEERTQDETLQQERCARREARDLAETVYKLQKRIKTTFYSPSEAW